MWLRIILCTLSSGYLWCYPKVNKVSIFTSFQTSSSIRTPLSNALLLHKSHCASVKCLCIAKPTVSQPRKHLHFAKTDAAESCGQMMSERKAYGPVHPASFCAERRGLKLCQKIPLGSQLLFYHEMSSLSLICLKTKAKAKLVPVIYRLNTSRPGWQLQPSLLYLPEHDTPPVVCSRAT